MSSGIYEEEEMKHNELITQGVAPCAAILSPYAEVNGHY